MSTAHFRSMDAKNLAHWASLQLPASRPELIIVAIQFPDPWAKARHKNRCLVDPDFVRLLDAHLGLKSAIVYVSSDRQDVYNDMVSTLSEFLGPPTWRPDFHPLSVGTERDIVCEKNHRAIYRAVWGANAPFFPV
eukprot:GEMP01096063.1.p1 GENE.GEMP01096063.1~~GEMP01096063.1.p1  ORF type:complete len:135 (+),score=22.42 GEMP01096063.1:447-851(+)